MIFVDTLLRIDTSVQAYPNTRSEQKARTWWDIDTDVAHHLLSI